MRTDVTVYRDWQELEAFLRERGHSSKGIILTRSMHFQEGVISLCVAHQANEHPDTVPEQFRFERKMEVRFDHRAIHADFLAAFDIGLGGMAYDHRVDRRIECALGFRLSKSHLAKPVEGFGKGSMLAGVTAVP